MKEVQVLVSQCIETGAIYGNVLHDRKYPSLAEAWRAAHTKRADGTAVIIRPTYNEKDAKGRYLREWRSFNGEAFKECRWDF